MSFQFVRPSYLSNRRNLLLSSLLATFYASAVLFISPVEAKVINASSGTTSAIQTAISQTSPGDTVKIPAGTFSYSGSIAFNAGITILGAGNTATILNKSGTSTTPMFTVNGSNGLRTTMGNFAIVGVVGSSSTVQDHAIRLNTCKDFHLYEITFRSFGYSAVYVKGNSRGLIRKCSFIDIFRPAINNLGYGVVVYGDANGAWSRPLDLGTENAVYVEDCYFKANRHAIASNDGARYVFRYNTVMDNGGNFQPIDAHGREYGSPRGSRSYEIYNNTVDNSVRSSWCQIFIRGGDGVIFNNTLLRGTTSNHILLANRSDGGHTSTSYPAPDQTRLLYVWNNKISNGNVVGVTIRSGHESFFKLGRDYWHEPMPGYKPYTYPHPLSGGAAEPPVVTPPSISTSTLTDAVEGRSYSLTLKATGGTTPYSWSISSGSLPSGMQLSTAGVISGTPTVSGSKTFTVSLVDGGGLKASKQMSLNVKSADEANLASSSTLLDDCNCLDSQHPVQNLWDGDTSGGVGRPGSGTSDSLWVEYDLGKPHKLSKVRLFGDAEGSWVSRNFSVYAKDSETGNYSAVVDRENCFANNWVEKNVDANARFVKLVVHGDPSAGSVQVRQFEMYGTIQPSTAAITAGNISAGMKARILEHTPGKILRYSVPQTAQVRLTIHDLRGRMIAQPLNETQIAGIHEFNLDSDLSAGNMASGHYIYRLSIGDEVFTIAKPMFEK